MDEFGEPYVEVVTPTADAKGCQANVKYLEAVYEHFRRSKDIAGALRAPKEVRHSLTLHLYHKHEPNLDDSSDISLDDCRPARISSNSFAEK